MRERSSATIDLDSVRARNAAKSRKAVGGGGSGRGRGGGSKPRLPVQLGVGHPRRRARALLIAFGMVLTVFVAQLLRVQGLDAASVSQKALSERVARATIPAKRGDIVDASGVTLARSVERRNVTADPLAASTYARYDKQPDGTRKKVKLGLKGAADAIAPIVGDDPATLLKTLQDAAAKSRRFVYLAKDISPQQWVQISDLGIPGIFSERTVKREYPQGTALAPLLGWVSADGKPGGGVEVLAQKQLNGTPGTHVYERAADGTTIATGNNKDTPAADGRPVQLTINNDLQWTAQNLIAAQVKKTKALSGEAVVMDRKGNIIAAASYPSFDNNQIATAQGSMLSRPFADSYEPGSTNKVVTMAAALAEGKVTPTTTFTVPYGLPRADQTFTDSHHHPTETMTTAGILADSSNTGTIQVGEKMSAATLRNYMTRFGQGQPTGINFPGENVGSIPTAAQMTGSRRYTVMFGQGLSSNTMQQISVFQTIANGGVREPIKLVKGIGDGSGGFTAPADDRVAVQVVPASVATQMTRMMQAVPTKNGTAPKAVVEGYNVAGKTGTAARYDESLGRYNGWTASFIGFAPAENPQYIVSVALQRPTAVSIYGGEVAAPVFSQLMAAALRNGHVPPSTVKPSLYDLKYDPSKDRKQ